MYLVLGLEEKTIGRVRSFEEHTDEWMDVKKTMPKVISIHEEDPSELYKKELENHTVCIEVVHVLPN